jgi:hypothetical protein
VFADRPRLSVATPPSDAVETATEVLVKGELVPHPEVAGAAEVLGFGAQVLAQSLEEPLALRTPEHVCQTLAALQALVLGAADAVEAVGRSVEHAQHRGDMQGRWTEDDRAALTAAAGRLRDALPLLGRSKACVQDFRYTGPGFDTERDRIRALAGELRRRGATVTFDPTTSPGYEDSEAIGGGWLLQFQLPGDDRHFQLLIGDTMAFEDALPLELTHNDVHPALVVAHILENLDDFVTTYLVDPDGRDGAARPGHVGPAVVKYA